MYLMYRLVHQSTKTEKHFCDFLSLGMHLIAFFNFFIVMYIMALSKHTLHYMNHKFMLII